MSNPRENVIAQKRKRVKHQSKTSPVRNKLILKYILDQDAIFVLKKDLDNERSCEDKGSDAVHSDGALRRRKICVKRKKT